MSKHTKLLDLIAQVPIEDWRLFCESRGRFLEAGAVRLYLSTYDIRSYLAYQEVAVNLSWRERRRLYRMIDAIIAAKTVDAISTLCNAKAVRVFGTGGA